MCHPLCFQVLHTEYSAGVQKCDSAADSVSRFVERTSVFDILSGISSESSEQRAEGLTKGRLGSILLTERVIYWLTELQQSNLARKYPIVLLCLTQVQGGLDNAFLPTF